MNFGAILSVAGREYRHHAKSKGFWLTILVVPVVALLAGLIPQWVAQNKPARAVLVIDQSGGPIARTIDHAIEVDKDKRILGALKEYVAANVPPDALQSLQFTPFGSSGGDVTDADVDAFLAWGGLAKADQLLPGLVKPGSAKFEPPAPRFIRVTPPPEIDISATPAILGVSLGPYLRGEKPIQSGSPSYLSSAVIVPAGYDLLKPDSAIQYWSININEHDFVRLVADTLTQAARQALYKQSGVSPETVANIEARSVALQAFNPNKASEGGEISTKDRVVSIVPLGLALMLWTSIFTVANLLLLGVIEERSNKLIEVLLSSISAGEFMAGKLLGIAGIGFSILTAWIGIGLLILMNSSGPTAQAAYMALGLILSGPYLLAFLFYFIVGYLTIASIFLGLGSISNSQQEAQSLLTPLVFVLMLPFFLIGPMMEDPNGAVATTIGWIPLYTPFVMMVRLSTNPSFLEVVASGALTLLFSLVVLWGMTRLFRNAILRTGQRPRLIEIWRMIARRET